MFHHTMVSMGMSIGQPYTFYSIGSTKKELLILYHILYI